MEQPRKTLNPEMLAGAGVEGSSTPPTVEEGYADSVAKFAEKNYQRLSSWCHARWDGQGQDVLHEAIRLAAGEKKEDGTWQRKPLEYMTFSLFRRLCREAARNLGIYRTVYTADGVILDPPREGMPSLPAIGAGTPPDGRIEAAMRYAAPGIQRAMQMVLDGHTFRDAAHELGIRESELSRRLGELGGRVTGQLNLFIEGVAA